MEDEINKLVKYLVDKIDKGKLFNEKTVFPKETDKNFVINFLDKYISKNKLVIFGNNAISYYLKKNNKIKLPIYLYSKNPEKDIINISKKIASNYDMIKARKIKNEYKILWEGQYEPIIIIKKLPNIKNKSKFIKLEYILLDIFLDYITPRSNYYNWKDNIKVEKKLINLLKIKSNNRDILNNDKLNLIIKILKNEKNYFFSGLQQLKFEKKIKNIDYLDIFSLDSKNLISKIKKIYPKIKVKDKEKYFDYLPKSYELYLNNKLLIKIYEIDKCYTHNGFYSNIYHLLIILIINEPTLINLGLEIYNNLADKFKYQGDCIGPLPEPINKSKFISLFSK